MNFVDLDKSDVEKLNFNEIKEIISELKNNYKEYNFQEIINSNVITVLKMDERKNVQGLLEGYFKFIDKLSKEILRVKTMYDFDMSFGKYDFIAGVDEVGRGPLAGPIVSAAVILDLNYKSYKDLLLGIKDSKKLSAKLREELSEIIKEKALYYSFSAINNDIIDSSGISWSNNEIFRDAISKLDLKPNLVLSDGYGIKNFNIENRYVIKGDAKSASIACASIIAKVYRDKIMNEYSKLYPYYGFEKNSGYGTEEHIQAIKKYGTCKIHRNSFLKNIL